MTTTSRQTLQPAEALELLAQKLPSWTRERIEALLERMASIEDDWKFIDERRKELTESYPDEWVAVLHRRVVGHNPDSKELHGELRKDGLQPGLVAFGFLHRDPPNLTLYR